MHDLLGLNVDNDEFFNFERCGDVIVSVQNNTCALFCKFCRDIFTNLLDFLRHLQQQHNDVLNFKVAHNVYSVEELLNTNYEEDIEEEAPVDSAALPADILKALQAYDVEYESEEYVKKAAGDEASEELALKKEQKPFLNSTNLTEYNAKNNLMQLEKGQASFATRLAMEMQTEVTEIVHGLHIVEKLLQAEELQSFNFDKENQSYASLTVPSTSKTRVLKQRNFFGAKTNASALSELNLSNRVPMAEYMKTDGVFGQQRPVPDSQSDELESTNDNKFKNILQGVKRNAHAPIAADISCLPERTFHQRGHFFDFQQPKPMKTPKNRCDSKSYAIQRVANKKEIHRRMTQLKKRIFNSLNSDYKKREKCSEKLKINSIEILPNLEPNSLAKLVKMAHVTEKKPQQEERALSQNESNASASKPVIQTNIQAAASARISTNTNPQEMSQAVPVKIQQIEIPKIEREPTNNSKSTETKLTAASVLESNSAKAPSNPAVTLKLPGGAYHANTAANIAKSVGLLNAKDPNVEYITFMRPAKFDNTITEDNSKIQDQSEISAHASKRRAPSPQGLAATKCAKSITIQLPISATEVLSASNSLDGMQLELSDSAVEFLHADFKSHKLNVDSILNSNLSTCSSTMAYGDVDEDPYEGILIEVQNKLCAAQNTKPKSPGATAEDPAEVIILADAQLLKTVGLQIIHRLDNEMLLTGKDTSVLYKPSELAEKFSELLKQYTSIWQTRYGVEQKVQRDICQQEFTRLMAETNATFNVEFSMGDVKRLVNMVTIWFSKQWDLKMIQKAFIPNAYEHIMNLFSFMPKMMRRYYYCEYCEEQFYSEGKYESHRLLHTDAKRFKCTLCPKSFNWEGHLARHKRSHN